MHHDDISHTLPAGTRLLPGEELQNVIKHEPRLLAKQLSSLGQLLRLTGAKRGDEIGKFGPSIAALALGDTTNTPAHLRLYEVMFGRDSLRVAIDLISSYPHLARSTTLALAKLQGTSYNTQREEEPGRIVHEARDQNDPIARDLTERLGWGWPYYGSVDATPEFVRTLSAYVLRSPENQKFLQQSFTNKDDEDRTMAHALAGAVYWITRRLDSNPEGLLEFCSVLPQGIENQVWKDSWDAYHHENGDLANHDAGIASIEVQVTTYDALLDAAEVYETILDREDEAHDLRLRAEKLRQSIIDIFWTTDKGGYFVLGTDRHPETGALRQLKIRTSNMGHALNSRLLEGTNPASVAMRESLIRHIMSPELLNVSGIRTLASDEYRFRAGAYHNGSVWLWDTHHIAKGLRRLGYSDQADDLDRRIVRAASVTHGYPEYVRGDDEQTASLNTYTINVWDAVHQRINKIEQPPQEVQAWTVAAILAIKKRLKRRHITPVVKGSSVNYHHPHLKVPPIRRSSTQSRPAADIHHRPQHPDQ